MFQSTGRLIYDPYARIKFEPYWLILKTSSELNAYYQSMILQKYDVRFKQTVWGSHISVVRGTVPPKLDLWNRYQGKVIKFSYSNDIRYSAGGFFHIPVESKELEEIRISLGLTPRPSPNFHLTIGRVNKVTLARKKELWERYVDNELNLGNIEALRNNETLHTLINIP